MTAMRIMLKKLFSQIQISTSRSLRLCAKILLILFFVFLSSDTLIHAQAQPWWLSLEQGKQHFRNGALGKALLSFEDARRTRLERFSRMERDLIMSLSSFEMRRFGDDLEFVERALTSRPQDRGAEVLKEIFYYSPRERMGNSVNNVLMEIDRYKVYPEAEFWLGETFRAEGELGLALRQYQKAYNERALLEIPGFEVEILYRMVEIHRLRQEYQEMENRALEILRSAPANSGTPRDNLWAGDGSGFTRAAMVRILENDGINRFLTIYRYDNFPVERAHRFLGMFYFASSRHTQAAEHLMFSFLIQNTLLINEAMRREFDFLYTTLDALIDVVERRPDLMQYVEESEYFRTLYFFGASLYATGRQIPARQIWTFLANRPVAGEWSVRSRNQLQNPYIERAVEVPTIFLRLP